MNYQQAETQLSKARKPDAGSPIAKNTRLFRRAPDAIAVRFHQTDVALLKADGSVTLDSGGWRTPTTKERMNMCLRGAWVSQSKGQWYIKGKLFQDGCRLTAKGAVIGAGTPAAERAAQGERTAVTAYAKEYIRKLYAGELPAPSNGDCWACLMRSKSADGSTAAPLHDTGAHSHIAEHVREGYYVPSLLLLACEQMGASIAAKHDAAYYLKLPGWESTRPFIGPETMRRDLHSTLRRFVLRSCGMA